MIEAIKRMVRKPTPIEMAMRELEEARRSRLDAQSAEEYARSVVRYNEERIARLSVFVKSEGEAT